MSSIEHVGADKKCESGACIVVDVYHGEHLTDGAVVRVRSTETGTVMQATLTEWDAFIQQAKLGYWDRNNLPLADNEAHPLTDDERQTITAAEAALEAHVRAAETTNS